MQTVKIQLFIKENPPVLNWQYQLTQVILYSGHKMVVIVAVVVVIVNQCYSIDNTELETNFLLLWSCGASREHLTTG